VKNGVAASSRGVSSPLSPQHDGENGGDGGCDGSVNGISTNAAQRALNNAGDRRAPARHGKAWRRHRARRGDVIVIMSSSLLPGSMATAFISNMAKP